MDNGIKVQCGLCGHEWELSQELIDSKKELCPKCSARYFPDIQLICGSCNQPFVTNQNLMDQDLVKCPWCGTKWAPGFDWDVFKQYVSYEPAETSSVVLEAISDLKADVEQIKEINKEPIEFAVDIVTKLILVRQEYDQLFNAWQEVKKGIKEGCKQRALIDIIEDFENDEED